MEVKTALVLLLLHGVVNSDKPGKPTLIRCPDWEIVNTGDAVTWTCVADSRDAESQGSYKYQWYKYSYSKYKCYFVGIHSENGQTFTKENVSPDDSGYYGCKTGIGWSWSDVRGRQLIVKDLTPVSPTMLWFPLSGSINVGGTLNIICLADPNKGVPSSFELLRKHGGAVDKIVSPTFQESSISQVQAVMWSKSVNLKDKGDYVCRAVYPCGRPDDSLPKTLDVQDPPSPKPIITFESKASLNVGDTLKLTCETQTYKTDIQFKWYKDGLFTNEENQIYENQNVVSTDSGNYVCQATSGRHTIKSKVLIISIVSPSCPNIKPVVSLSSPASLNVNDTLKLTCETKTEDVTGIKFKWFRNDSLIKNEDMQVYEKDRVDSKDAGSYICQTSQMDKLCSDDKVNSTIFSISIATTTPITPTVHAPERLTMTWFPDTGPITVGDTLIVLCRAAPEGGRPASYELCRKHGENKADYCASTFTHVMTGDNMGQGHGGMFYKSVTRDDHGEYYCRAINTAGSAQSDDQMLSVSEKDTEYWTSNCSDMWTPWATENLTSNLEHRSQLCWEISPEGKDRKWTLKKDTRIKQVSEIAASFRSTKTFTNKLLDEASQEYKNMKEHFELLLQNAYKSKVESGEMKGVIITGFKEGSVIVHYKIILKVSVNITDTAAVSTILENYLKVNPNEAKKYDIAPESAGTGTKDSQTSSQKILQNKVDVISAITATLIVILIVTVVVLIMFLIRLKRQVMEKQFAGDGVEYTAGVNGHRPPGVKVKKSNGLDADNTYAAIGEKEPVSDLYRSLGQQKRIAKPKASRENPAFETEEADYLDIVGDGGVVSPNMRASLEDGYQGNDPVYHVLESDAAVASKKPGMAGNDADYSLAGDAEWTKGGPNAAAQKPDMAGTDADYSLAGDAQWTNGGPNAATAPTGESVYSLAQDSAGVDDDYATPDKDDYAVLNKKKVDGAKGTKPGWVGFKTKPKPPLQKPQTGKITKGDAYDNMDVYSHTYAHAPGSASADGSKMAANGCQGNTNEDEEYSRLQLPILTKPRTMQNLQKSPRHHQNYENSTPAADDNNDDYDYGSVCDVVS